MAQIGRESDEVPGDRAALGAALFEDPRREGMPKVVDAGRSRPLRSYAGTSHNAAESIVRCVGSSSFCSGRKGTEDRSSRANGGALVEIAFERLDDVSCSGTSRLLPNLRFADVQHAARQNIVEPERNASEMRRPVAAIRPNNIT